MKAKAVLRRPRKQQRLYEAELDILVTKPRNDSEHNRNQNLDKPQSPKLKSKHEEDKNYEMS